MLRRRRRTTFRTIRHIIFAALMGIVFALSVALVKFDINALNNRIVETFEQQTGIKIEITGNMSWNLSLRPEISVKNVRIKSEPWAQNPYAVNIPELIVRLDLPSLFRQSQTIQSVRIIRPTVFIEENQAGEISIPRRPRAEVVRIPMAVRKSEFPITLDFGINSFELVRPRISYITPDRTELIAPDYVRMSLLPVRDTLDLAGSIISDRVEYPFQISFNKFNEEAKNYRAKIAMTGSRTRLTGDLLLDDKSRVTDLVVRGRLRTPGQIIQSMGFSAPAMADMDVVLDIGIRRRMFIIRGFSIKTDKSDISFSGRIDNSRTNPVVTADIVSNNFDLGEFFPRLYGRGSKWVRPNRPLNVFKDTPLYGELLSEYDGTVQIKMGKLGIYREMNVLDILAEIKVNGGVADIKTDTMYMGGRVLGGVNLVHVGGGVLDATVAGIGRTVSLGELMESIRERDTISGLPFDMDFYLETRGKDLEDIIKNANGPIRIVSTAQGFAYEDLLVFLYGRDFLTALRERITGLFSSRHATDQMRVNCVVMNLLVRDGSIELDRNGAIETDAVIIRVLGNVDFGRELITLSLDTTPADGIRLSFTGNFINSINLTGSLAEPDLKLNREAVVGRLATATGVGIAVGALTGGIGLLVGAGAGLVGGDMLGNWASDSAPCRTALGSGAPGIRRGEAWFMSRSPSVLAEEFIKN